MLSLYLLQHQIHASASACASESVAVDLEQVASHLYAGKVLYAAIEIGPVDGAAIVGKQAGSCQYENGAGDGTDMTATETDGSVKPGNDGRLGRGVALSGRAEHDDIGPLIDSVHRRRFDWKTARRTNGGRIG